MRTVCLIVACSAAKRLAVDPSLVVTPDCDPMHWVHHLDHAARTTTARRLYTGQHAKVCRNADTATVQVQIASAGWGLIGLDDPIASYDATFSTGTAATICGNHVAWWNALAARAGRLAALAGPVIVALSPPYLAAVRDDLAGCGPNVAVVVAATRAPALGVETLAVPAKSVSRVLGGGMVSANARLGRWAAQQRACGTDLTEVARTTFGTIDYRDGLDDGAVAPQAVRP